LDVNQSDDKVKVRSINWLQNSSNLKTGERGEWGRRNQAHVQAISKFSLDTQ